MGLSRLLIANRGEIAIRVARTATELGLETVAIFSEDDRDTLHTRKTDDALALRGQGAAAYLDAEQIVDLAAAAGCDAVHPGYGFLSENAAFAQLCQERGLRFVGPRPEVLALFGDKLRARSLAEACGVPVAAGRPVESPDEARAFLAAQGPGGSMLIKALAGGGGRGTRAVAEGGDVGAAFERCRSEARAAFGNEALYVEREIRRPRHVEVQIAGDGAGGVRQLGERDCTIQRRFQKVVEMAPSPALTDADREPILAAAVALAREARFDNVGTFEFLVEEAGREGPAPFVFIEANPRLQVEHTVTEEVTGIDLVRVQLGLAAGSSLEEVGLGEDPVPRGCAIQLRVNAETPQPDGTTRPSGGSLTSFEPPSGPGIRTDTHGTVGYAPSPRFDSLLAKVIVRSPGTSFDDLIARAYRALCEFRIEGVETNLRFLQNLLRHPDFLAGRIHTRFAEEASASLADPGATAHRRLFLEASIPAPEPEASARAGARVDPDDPLAVLAHGRGAPATAAMATTNAVAAVPSVEGPEGTVAVKAPIQGTVVSLEAGEGDLVRAGQPLLVMEAMKMEHVIEAACSGVVRRFAVAAGDTVFEGHALVFVEETGAGPEIQEEREEVDLDRIRPDLREVQERHAVGLDAARPEAVARRRKTGQRTARENVEDLCDPDSYVEYGPLVIAAQRRRRTLEDLIARTPADGMLAGIGRVNGDRFDETRSRCAVMSYDYTVLAGTQGLQNHRKKDRLFEIAERWRLPLVFFTEGGGGRPGDTDGIGAAGLDCWAFQYFAKLSGLVPLVGINSGRCFAGNAALLGCCDVVIATENSNIGMGGPAMIEGGGLGVFRPEDVGPLEVQARNGVVDVTVADEAEAVRVAKRYLGYFQGPLDDFSCADQRLLRGIVPENRLRIYDVRSVIETLADVDSVLELRRSFGVGMVTSFVRIEGRPVGVIANNPTHLAGAIDSDGADKATRFMQLCDAFDIPILFLCDTPGIMVGPEVERTALVRHAARMFVNSASLDVPFFTIVLRKGYGLGAQAMAGGSFKAPFFTVSWPTGEFGGMGLEGAVKLGYRKELEAQEDPAARRDLYEQMVERMYQHGKAVSTASFFEIDDVIDPADSRRWIGSALRSAPPPPRRTGKKRPCVDTW